MTRLADLLEHRSSGRQRDVMAEFAARHRAMTRKTRLGIAVAVKTKTMKPRLHSDLEIRPRAAMTMNAGVEPAAIGVVMVADKTVDGYMFAMVEVQGQRRGAAQ